jgi:DNA repair exonuclease SbcCD ATPase subunit
MIPQRIAVRGFLCYRDEQEICFDSASLWLLAGLNGSGKSALFDAVTYALFGGHRGGLIGAQALINKHSESLAVEFDFLLDNQLYQARRTLRVNSKGSVAGTQQIRQWRGQWETVPDTTNKAGFDSWIRENIGLTYDTFTSSVLLMQGKAEKLLAAAPKERFEVLAGIVDLNRYQKLHKRADDRRRKLEVQLEMRRQQLLGLEDVTEADLETADQELAAAQDLLRQAQLEVERLRALSLALPVLRRLHRERERLRQARGLTLKAAEEERRATLRVKHLENRLAPVHAEQEQARQTRQASDHQLVKTKTLLDAATKRAARFRSMAAEKTCTYCGQPLTLAHIQVERAKLVQERTTARSAYRQALKAQRTADRQEKRWDRKGRKIQGLLDQARLAAAEWLRQRERALLDADHAFRECTQAYQELAEPYRSRVSREAPSDWEATSFPTAEDLDDLQQGQAAFQPDRLRHLEERFRQAQLRKDRLTDRREQRRRLEKECLALDKDHHRSRLLAELLGRNRLQLHLVRQAERKIVDCANAVLDRLSGGQLYLRLHRDSDGEGAADQALHLEAYNRTASPEPIGVAFLSGSQRFRVAVSLALGIGQYASRRHRPIESVIIDEGFGCLDRQGRQVMIQELHNLKGQLRCVLLVSHQEEFAEAFPDGYRFELIEGTTVATRFSH